MRILLLGASGFIGREVFAALAARGHELVPAVRRAAAAPAFSSQRAVEIDLNRDVDVAAWLPRLSGIDAVVNCAGILQEGRGQSIEAIHARAPIALFEACAKAGVRRVVQVSAISATREAGTAYAATKLAADDHLRAMALEWTLVRPSLVHARGSYGGTSVLRALAALPFAIPIPGDGSHPFQPIWIDDLCEVIAMALETDRLVRRSVDPVGPQVVTLREIVEDLRRWLGFGQARVVRVPMAFVRAVTKVGDALGATIGSTALRQLEHGNTGDYAAFSAACGLQARGWREALASHPAHAQDRWHARLYFVRPLLRFTVAVLWLVSGFAGLAALREWSPLLAQDAHIPLATAFLVLAAACFLDIGFAILVARRWRPRTLALLQLAAIAIYTLVATLLWPSLWAEALAPLAKNLPIAAAVLALGALEEER
jgi:uncharacterized protein YbjT (DUF2867 family)